jgi:HEAT repeat protein
MAESVVVIRRSSAGEIRHLRDRLLGHDPLERDAAAARLTVLGARAVPSLIECLDRESPDASRIAVLRTLEAISDPRALASAGQLVNDPDVDVASAAVGLLRTYLRSRERPVAESAFERLTAVALDATRAEPVRAAALEALSDLAPDAVSQLLRALEQDTSAAIRRVATRPTGTADPVETLARLASAARCPEPDELRRRLAAAGADVPLPVLGRLVDAFREREAAETAPPRRTEWQAARAAVHQLLAARGSRLALYDLRETLAVVPGPLPVGFIAALERVGDAGCLDAMAAAYARARQAGDAWWTAHLLAAFRAILRRERLTRRSPAVRHLIARRPEAAAELLPGRR